MSNVYTTLSQSNDKMATLRDLASIAASQIEAGALSHGTGAILEVALIASAISQGAISYTSDERTYTFDKAKAIEAARVIYNRYKAEYGEGNAGAFPFGAKGEELAAWRNRTLAMLHPYTYSGMSYAWTKTAKQITAEVMSHHVTKKPSEREAIEKLVEDALDRTNKARVAARKLWDIACLYVALDDNGALLKNSNTDPKATKAKDFGLRMRIFFFIPYKRVSVDTDINGEVFVVPVDRRSGALYHYERTSSNTQGKHTPTRVSLDSFDAAWKLPVPKLVATSNPWVDAVKLLNTLTPEMELHPDAISAWDDMFAKVVAFNDRLNEKRHGPKPEPVVDPATLTAAQIAGKPLIPVAKSA